MAADTPDAVAVIEDVAARRFPQEEMMDLGRAAVVVVRALKESEAEAAVLRKEVAELQLGQWTAAEYARTNGKALAKSEAEAATLRAERADYLRHLARLLGIPQCLSQEEIEGTIAEMRRRLIILMEAAGDVLRKASSEHLKALKEACR